MRKQVITETAGKASRPRIVQTAFRLPIKLHWRLKLQAAKEKTTINAIVTQAIEARLERAA